MKKFIGYLGLTAVLAALSLPAAAQTEPDATAELLDAEGNRVGTVEFTSVEDGVQIRTLVEGFDAAVTGDQRGQHGLHIHETGECTAPDFSSAGGHFNPTDADHGLLDPDGPHAGDLPNIWIEADGSADYTVTTNLITLEEGDGQRPAQEDDGQRPVQEGDRSLFDSDGSAIIIHSGADDYITDPSGDSGDRLACGVIEPNQ
ncbi:superoxide dismutase [filamentous cyanobacterium CCT1]|nr:superoxide dismutase [filamentous cyanobacterium CCT1]PSN81155.1 superoxide dismutase [filamentous cyanobacterium CCP4]